MHYAVYLSIYIYVAVTVLYTVRSTWHVSVTVYIYNIIYM